MKPYEYELQVKNALDNYHWGVKNFRTLNREIRSGSDGDYEIDITISFQFMKMEWLILAECKYHKTPVKRDYVMILNQKRESLKAQRSVMFSTSGYQSGAIEFAKEHKIGLFKLENQEIQAFSVKSPTIFRPIPLYIVGIDNHGKEQLHGPGAFYKEWQQEMMQCS